MLRVTKAVCVWLLIVGFFGAAHAQDYRAKWPSDAKIEAALNDLKDSYGDVPLGINCKAPNGRAEIIICADPYLLKLALLTARTKFYATENATRQRVNRKSKEVWWIPTKCSTIECIYSAFKEQIESAGAGAWNPFD